jgi:hypothetical protein
MDNQDKITFLDSRAWWLMLLVLAIPEAEIIEITKIPV